MLSNNPVIPQGPVVDLRAKQQVEQARNRGVQDKLESVACAIYAQTVALGLSKEPPKVLADTEYQVVIAAAIDAALVLGKGLFGVSAVRSEEVPPPKSAEEPF